MSYNLLTAFELKAAQSLAASFSSAAVEVKLQDNVGIQLNWTGTPVGQFNVEVSMDYKSDLEGNITNTGNWTALPLDPTITATGSANTAYIDLNQLSAPYVRVSYIRTSGTGSVDIWVTAKGV